MPLFWSPSTNPSSHDGLLSCGWFEPARLVTLLGNPRTPNYPQLRLVGGARYPQRESNGLRATPTNTRGDFSLLNAQAALSRQPTSTTPTTPNRYRSEDPNFVVPTYTPTPATAIAIPKQQKKTITELQKAQPDSSHQRNWSATTTVD